MGEFALTGAIDEAAIDRFWTERAKLAAIEAARFHPELTPYDLALIEPHIIPGQRILDLGCGTCALTNALAINHDVHVHAVDKYAGMLKLAESRPNISTEVADAVGYSSKEKFDIVLLFGVINSIPRSAERMRTYRSICAMLNPGGRLILKSQFGVNEEVTVDTYSEALAANYVAVYPHINEEVSLLSTIFNVALCEPYPSAFNKWENTRFYALDCVPGAM